MSEYQSIVMDFSIHIDTISMDLSILYFKGLPIKIAIKVGISVSESCFILANDEMPLYLSVINGLFTDTFPTRYISTLSIKNLLCPRGVVGIYSYILIDTLAWLKKGYTEIGCQLLQY